VPEQDKRARIGVILEAVKTKLKDFANEHALSAATLFIPSYLGSSFGTFRVLAVTRTDNLFEYERVPSGQTRNERWASLAAFAIARPAKLIRRAGEQEDDAWSHFPVFGDAAYDVGAYGYDHGVTFVLEGMVARGGLLPNEKVWREVTADLVKYVNEFDDLDPARFSLNLLRSNGDTGGVVCTDITHSAALFKEDHTEEAIQAIRKFVDGQETIARNYGGMLLTSSGDGCTFLFPMCDDQPIHSGSVAAIQAAKDMVMSFESIVNAVLGNLVSKPDIYVPGETYVDSAQLGEILEEIRIRVSVAAGVWLYNESASPLVRRTAMGAPIHRAGYLNQVMKNVGRNAVWVDDFAYARARSLDSEVVSGFARLDVDARLKSGRTAKPWEWTTSGG